MKRTELYRAVAAATGESVAEIKRRGFQLVDTEVADFDRELGVRPPSTIDWDRSNPRHVSLFPSASRDVRKAGTAA